MAKVDWSQFAPVEPEKAAVDWSQFTPVAEAPKAEPSFFDKIGNELGQLRDEFFSGVTNVSAGMSTLNTTAAANQLLKKQEELAALEAAGKGATPEAESTRKWVSAYASRMPTMVKTMSDEVKLANAASQMTTRDAVKKVGQAKSFGEAWSTFTEAPYDVIAGVTAQSLPAVLPALLATAATRNVVAGSAIMGTNSAMQEIGGSISEYASDNGVDPADQEALSKFLADPVKLREAMDYAGKRGVIIGAMDAASGGLASKTLAPKILTNAIAKQAVNLPSQMAAQAAFGAGGEAGAQLATKGEVDQPGQVLMEAVGELGGAPAEVLAFAQEAATANQPPAPPPQPTSTAPKVEDQPTTPVAPVVQPKAAQAVDNIAKILAPAAGDPIAPTDDNALLAAVPIEGQDAQTPTTDAGAAVAPAASADQPAGDGGTGQADGAPAPTVPNAVQPEAVSATNAAATATVSQTGSVPTAADPRTAALAKVEAELQAARARVEAEAQAQQAEAAKADAERRSVGSAYQQTSSTPTPLPGAAPSPALVGRLVQRAKDTFAKNSDLTDTNVYPEPVLYGIINSNDAGPDLMAAARQELGRRRGTNTQPTVSYAANLEPGTTSLGVGGQPSTAATGTVTGQAAVQQQEGSGAAGVPAGTPSFSNQPTTRTNFQLADPVPSQVIELQRAPVRKAKGVEFKVSQRPLTREQELVSALARMMGKNLSWIERDSGDQQNMPDGFVTAYGGKYILMDVNGSKPLLEILLHEGTHALPKHIRGKLLNFVLARVSDQGKADFLKRYDYAGQEKGVQDEEVLAFVGQQIARRPEFIQDLKTALGNKDFAELARVLIAKMKDWLGKGDSQFDREFLGKHVQDVQGIHDKLVKAYAQAMQEQGLEPDAALVQAPNPQTDQINVGGVAYSSKVSLVDAPEINMQDLVGKRVMPIKADLTAAGREYTGIDGSKLYAPVPLMGGPGYPRLPNSAQNNLIWAVREGSTKLINKAQESDVILVIAMNDRSHRTNFTVSSAYIDTVEAYLRDKKLSKQDLKALDSLVRAEDKKHALNDFPGFAHANVREYLDSLSFDKRGALATILETKEAQRFGLPNFDRYAREMMDPDYAGHRPGDVLLAMELDKANPLVQLGQDGTDPHPSYPQGLRGRLLGKFPVGINYRQVFQDYFQNTVPTFKGGEANAWYSLDRVTPVQQITSAIAQRFPVGGYEAISSPRQAKALLSMANGDWLQSGKTKANGGVSIQEFVDALRSNDGAAALTVYTPEQVKSAVKDGSMTVYQLGKEGGDKGLQVFFGLKRGAPWYKGVIDAEVSDNEVELVSVTNNERGAPGVATPAILTKAIEEGATVLDAYAVKSKRFPDGFLPEMYAQFGFERIGSIKFDPKFLVEKTPGMSTYQHTVLTRNKLADLKSFWENGGWKETDGYPDVVVMRWRGEDANRAGTVDRYVRTGETGVPQAGARYYGSPTEETVGQRDPASDEQGRDRSGDAGPPGRDQGASNAAPVVGRAYKGIQSIAKLSDDDSVNLGLDPGDVGKLRDRIAFSNKSGSGRTVEPDVEGGSGARPYAVRVQGTHFSQQPRTNLDGRYNGTGLKGAERTRLSLSQDPRIKERVYFYVDEGNGIRPESGVGGVAHTADLRNIYDVTGDKAGLFKSGNDNQNESALLDAGYSGYYVPRVFNNQGVVVVLGNASRGIAVAQAEYTKGTAPAAPAQPYKRGLSSKELGVIDLTAVQEAAPSAKLRAGTFSVDEAELDAAREVLAGQGIDLPAAGPAFSNKANLDQDIVLEIPVEGGKTAKLTINAQAYINQLDAREDALRMVKECML